MKGRTFFAMQRTLSSCPFLILHMRTGGTFGSSPSVVRQRTVSHQLSSSKKTKLSKKRHTFAHRMTKRVDPLMKLFLLVRLLKVRKVVRHNIKMIARDIHGPVIVACDV